MLKSDKFNGLDGSNYGLRDIHIFSPGAGGGGLMPPNDSRHQPSLVTTHLTARQCRLAANDLSVCTITETAPTRAFSWLKAPTDAFTFKTLLRNYAKTQ